jgi:inner membrane protein
VDNITHSLVGVAVAELALPASATSVERRVLMVGSVVAANLPDIDLAYTWITTPPLGYLLHHRGHTHTLAGLLALAVALPLVLFLWPAARQVRGRSRAWLWAVVGANLVGHVSLDALNSYGVHPLYPFSTRWYYGDAVFIFEPLVWLLLGLAAAANARTLRVRAAVLGLLAFILVAITAVGAVPVAAIVANLAVALLCLAATRGAHPRARTLTALAVTTLFVVAMFGISRFARDEAIAAAPSHEEILDVIVSPDPGMPLCWSVIAMTRDRQNDTYRSSRGTLSLAPRWYTPAQCASYRLAPAPGTPVLSLGKVVWRDDFRQSGAILRDLDRRDCSVHAWLQFGRAPNIRGNVISDLRFDTGVRGNFTAMSFAGAPCPANTPNWTPPRADLLALPH